MNIKSKPSFPVIIGILFLSIQIGFMVYARFVPERFFCWAPYDQHTRYSIRVMINGESLPAKAIANRYRYQAKGWEPRCISNIFSIVEQYESTYGENDNAEVEITYSTNGHPERKWKLKQ